MIYKRGSRGEMVKQIQRALNLYPDGIFGPNTEEAVKLYQRECGLTADGIVGPATLAKLLPLSLVKSKRRIDEIIIHCSATPDGKDYTVSDIRRWHKRQGWSDIGYHYVIYRNGHVEPGRNIDIAGAHCDGHNTRSIGVCYVGGMDAANRKAEDTRTKEQKEAMLKLLGNLRRLYPNAKIVGHRDYDRHGKECPSFDATKEYRNI